ncbi:beta strand repeat-containing protein [Cellulophaga sp. Z1A5H]|uniref:beta strand repeat-containing protein n=1 Tax=Cellulophaga sp. Z1A5H TaxID=2687291 RepID=UPI0013FD6B3B|nr:hypothetical protein [Cellulophaga sp. Z1A5H]
MHKFNFKAVVIIAFLLLGAGFLNAQVKIGNNPQTINPASLLELESIDKAFVINRVNTAQMNAILPLEGAMVYNTEEQCLHYYDGLQWINICEAFGENLSFTSEALENPGNFESISITKTTDTNYNFEVGLLNASNIQDGTMGTTKLVDGAVTQNKLADNAVSNAKIQNGAIQPGKMAAGLPNTILQTNASSFVEWTRLNVDNVDGKDLTAGDASITVTNGLGATLVESNIRVADAGITNVKLGPDAVTTDKILNETILSEDILDGTIAEVDVADDAITNAKLADDAVNTAEIVDDAVTTAKIGTTAGDENKILGTSATGDPEWQDAATIAANLGEDVTSTNGSITGTALDAALVAMDLGIKADDITIEVNPDNVTGIQVKEDGITVDKIGADTTTDLNRLLGTDALGDAVWLDRSTIAISDFGIATADLDLGTFAITNLATLPSTNPLSTPLDAANRAYVDAAVGGSAQVIVSGDTGNSLSTSGIDGGAFYDASVKEDTGNKSNDGTLITNSATLFPTEQAVKTYVDTQITNSNTLADANILIGDATGIAQPNSISGDATLLNDGTLTIATDAITIDKIGTAGLADADKILKTDAAGDPVWADETTELPTLLDTQIIISDGTTANAQTVGGDATLANDGTLTIADDAITTVKILDANVTDDKLDKAGISLTGFAVPTADLSIGSFKLTDVADPTLDQDAATKIYVDTQITGSNALTDANIFIGDGSGIAQPNTITGDATLTNTGFLEIEDDAITTVKILDANVTDEKLNKAGISLTGFAVPTADLSVGTFKLTDVADPTLDQDAATKIYVDTQITGSNALADANIFIGDGSGIAQPNTITGDATLTNTGFLEIEDDAITTVKILDANVTDEKLNKAGISLTGFAVPTADLSVGSFKLTDVADPTLDQDAATKIYVDTQITGSNALADATIFIGDGSGIAQPNTITGDATLTNTGFLEIEDNVITATNLNADVAGAGLENDATTNALNVLVDNTTIEIDATNGLQVIDNSIGTSKIEDNSIVDADVNAGAAIDGSKINPVFTDNVSTTGTLSTTGTATIGANTITNVDGTVGQILTTDGAGVATWEDPATSIPMGTAGSIFFSDGASGLLENNSQLYWDEANTRLGIGTNTGLTNELTVNGTTRTSGLTNSDGTPGQPSYRFTGDADTGMWRGTLANYLRFSTSGVEAVTINPSQNVGIGTAAPTDKLHVAGSMRLNGSLKDKDGDTGTTGQVLTSTATGTDWKAPAVVAMGMVNQAANGSTTPPLASSPTKENGAVTSKISTGYYRVTFITGNTRADRLYTIQLTLLGSTGTASTIRVYAASLATAPTTTQFEVETLNSAGARVDSSWYYTVTDF